MGVGFFAYCFPGDSQVVTPQGMKKMSELRLGDKVRVVNANGSVQWSDVCAWAHREPKRVAKYLRLSTDRTARQITISADHLLPVVAEGKVKFMAAGDVRTGHAIVACDMTPTGGTQAWTEQVQRVENVERVGVYAPITTVGTIAVDGVAASCYSSTRSHRVAHAAMKPVRASWSRHPEHAADHHHGNHIAGSHVYIDRLAHVAGKA
jgi:hypothetical protein